MSRLPRHLEHLKTGFLAEAASAARCRAFAEHAEGEEMPNLARAWRDLAGEKDRLAILQLQAAGQVHGGAADLRETVGEERYENDVLYPKMIEDVGGDAAKVFEQVIVAQSRHLERMRELERELRAAGGDVTAPTGG